MISNSGTSVSLQQRPRMAPRYFVDVVPGEGVFLLSETQQTVLQGRLYELVAPALDGRTVEEICESLRDRATPAEVFYTLRKLDERGCLCEWDDVLAAPEATFWSAQGLDPAAVARNLQGAKVSLVAFGVDASPLASLLDSMRVAVDASAELAVVLTNHYLREELGAFNRQSLDARRAWLLVKPVGHLVWVGPLFRPGKTACWECLAERIRSNFPVLAYLEHVRGKIAAVFGRAETPATRWVATGLAAGAVAACLARGGESAPLEGKIQTFDTITGTAQNHTVVRRPSCSACGDPAGAAARTGAPLALAKCPKIYTADGGHRAFSPEETLKRYGHLVSPLCGAVTLLEPYLGADNDVMHVFFSGNNVARGPRNLMHLRTDLRSSSCGKGTNAAQAKVSALCEGLERYCGLFHGDEPRREARFDELDGAAIHPNDCMLFSEKQYAGRETQSCCSAIYHWVPRRFDPSQRISWTPVWSLTRQSVRYLPTAYCYFDMAGDPNADFCASCSNGNAAGNTLEEAILQGFLELVERDGVGLWWYNRLRRPGVDLAGFDEPYFERLAAYLKTKGRDLWALDLTTDLEIPVFVAASRRLEGPIEQIMFGFGAHLDPRIALLRAVTELNQMLVPLLDAPPERPGGNLTDPATVHWLKTARLADHPYLVPSGPSRTASSYPKTWTDDLREDVLFCQRRVEQQGLEMLVLDQTRPEIGMPVVKVIVPGLRHFWARYAPGRLYDVPAKLGWIDRPLAEEELNPTPMFL